MSSSYSTVFWVPLYLMLLALWPRIFVRLCGPIVAIDNKNYKIMLGGGGFDRGGLWGLRPPPLGLVKSTVLMGFLEAPANAKPPTPLKREIFKPSPWKNSWLRPWGVDSSLETIKTSWKNVKFDSWFSEMDRASSKNSFGGQYPVSSGSTK